MVSRRAGIVTVFEQVYREGMAKHVGHGGLGDFGRTDGGLKRLLNHRLDRGDCCGFLREKCVDSKRRKCYSSRRFLTDGVQRKNFVTGIRPANMQRDYRPARGVLWHGLLILCAVFASGCHILRPRPVDYKSSMAREMTFNGIDALQRGRVVEAQNLFTKAAQAAPNDQRIRAELARTYVQNGQVHQAIAEMKDAVRLSGGEASYHVDLGQLYLQTRQLELAREQAALALNNNRRLAAAWALKGQVEAGMGELAQARVSLNRALAHDSELRDVRFQLAQVYHRLGQPQRALSVLESLLRQTGLDETPQEYLLLHGTALAQIGQLDKSAEVLASAAERPEPLPETLLELSRIQKERGDVANASRVLIRGRELYANRPEFQKQLDELLSGGDETARASTWK